MNPRIVFHGVAVLLLLAAVAAAQEPKSKSKPAPPATQSSDRESSQPSVSEVTLSAREASSGMATGRKSGAIHAADFNRSVTTARETGSGMATGRMAKPSQKDPDSNNSSRNSAHATESLDAADMDQVHSNPMYQPKGLSGTNPMSESKAKPAGSGSSSHDVVEYKDGEDGTTRTRPGNKKTN